MALSLTQKDLAVFRWLNACRFLTTGQLALATDESEANARRRLSRLGKANLLNSSRALCEFRDRRQNCCSVTPANAKRLAKVAPAVEVRPAKGKSLPASSHLLWINEIWLAVHRALEDQSYYSYVFFPHYDYDSSSPDSPVWISSIAPRKGARPNAIIADFVLVVKCPEGASLFFGEVDLGWESLDSSLRSRATIFTKLQAYAAFHDSNGYERLADELGESFSGFRVLATTNSTRRADNIRKLCSRLGSSEFVRVTTLDQISHETVFGPIWTVGADSEPRPLLRRHGQLAHTRRVNQKE